LVAAVDLAAAAEPLAAPMRRAVPAWVAAWVPEAVAGL
jgi:hypothetical protein